MNGVKKFREAINISRMRRLFYFITCRKKLIEHKYLNGSVWPELHNAPEPSQIMWSNLGYSRQNRYVRVLVVNFISIIVLCLGFYGIALG